MKDRLSALVAIIVLLCKIFWRWATPFWLFRDAQRGSREQRIANYRYNRAQRAILPGYALKWMAIAALLLLLLERYSGSLGQLIEGSPAYFCAALFCVTTGIGFSFACVIIAILLACYFFLAHVKL
jgi:hypothetical protein